MIIAVASTVILVSGDYSEYPAPKEFFWVLNSVRSKVITVGLSDGIEIMRVLNSVRSQVITVSN
jgi:hypothetical protein